MKYEPHFYLDNPKLKETFVIMAVSTTNGRLKYSTQLKISPKNWPEDLNQLPNGHLKTKIEELKSAINSYKTIYKITRQKPIPKEQVKEELDRKYNRIPKESNSKVKASSFTEITDKIIKLMKSGDIKNPKTGIKYADNSIISISNVKDNLQKFEKDKGVSVAFEETTEETYTQFCAYMNENGKRLSTLNTHIGYWKGLADHARNTPSIKIKINDWFDNKRFKMIPAKFPEKIALNEKDIKKLLDLKLTGSDKEIRDRFLINCKTALRISDMTKVTESDIENGVLNMITQKKNKEIAQPLSNQVKNIIELYDGKLPKGYDRSHINKRIKAICELAGINETIKYTEVIGGKLVEQVKKKYELVSNHTARRTGITEMRRNGLSGTDVDHMAGIAESTQVRYNKITPKETAQKVANNPYFNS